MKRKTLTISIRKIFCFILAIFIIYYGGMKIWAATVETTSVTFADNNLYQSLRTRLSKYIISRNDETKTLEIRTDGMPEITELDLSNCQISDLSGIESGNKVASLKNMLNIANALEMSLDFMLLNDIETENIKKDKYIDEFKIMLKEIDDKDKIERFVNYAKALSEEIAKEK